MALPPCPLTPVEQPAAQASAALGEWVQTALVLIVVAALAAAAGHWLFG
jgi:hypothetical protein